MPLAASTLVGVTKNYFSPHGMGYCDILTGPSIYRFLISGQVALAPCGFPQISIINANHLTSSDTVSVAMVAFVVDRDNSPRPPALLPSRNQPLQPPIRGGGPTAQFATWGVVIFPLIGVLPEPVLFLMSWELVYDKLLKSAISEFKNTRIPGETWL